MKKYVLVLLAVSIWTLPAFATTTWQVAPGRSSVNFKVQHLIFTFVEGKFQKFDGKVIAEGEDLTNARMEAKIETNSIYTGIEDRDKHLEGADFFNIDKYPEIVFTSKSIVKTNDANAYKITGDLTMHGVTRTIELAGKCTDKQVLSNGKTRMDLTATGTLNRFDYGLRWNELMETGKAIVGQNVDLSVKMVLLKN